MQSYAILCPGQGGQFPAMFTMTGNPILSAVPADSFDRILAQPEQLFANRFAQPLVVGCGLARWQRLRSRLPLPSLVAGYSVGELTAYGVVGALEMDCSSSLVAARAVLMDSCADPLQPQGLLAVSGLLMATLLPVQQRHRLFVAIVNGVDRVVLGGLHSDLLAAERELQTMGAVCSSLPVSVASHTPLMQPAAVEFAAVLANASWSDFQIPVLSGTSALKVRTPTQAQCALVDQLTTTIVWQDCMDACVENGITTTLELGPGDALSRMMQARHPTVAARSVDAFRSLDAACDWVLRQIS